MGSVERGAGSTGQAYELVLPWGPTLRGVRWGNSQAQALFLHEPVEGKDLDAWGDLPRRLAAALDASARVVDLPGHGLSDDPWEPTRLPGIVSALVGEGHPEHPLLIVAAAESALASLDAAASLRIAGVAALSPASAEPGTTLPRSAATAKLFFAGARDGESLAGSRKLAAAMGGFGVVTSIPTDARGSAMLATEWGLRLSEHIIAFARDVLFRQHSPLPASLAGAPGRSDRV